MTWSVATPDVRRVALEHLRHRVRARPPPRPSGGSVPRAAPDPVEVAKELVGAVDEVNDHGRAASRRRGRTLTQAAGS